MAARLRFKTPLSSTAVRILHLDLTKPLAAGSEVLTGTNPTVTASPAGIVNVTNVVVNAAQLTNSDGTVAAIGKAVQWKATVVKAYKGDVVFRVSWAVAGGGSADTHEIEQPIQDYVRE